jgi:hypothetical protein
MKHGFNAIFTSDDPMTTAMNEYYAYVLERYAKLMPEGRFWNRHNDGYQDSTLAIVMLASGEVCPVYVPSVCCLNPLKITDSEEKKMDGTDVQLSTWSCAGNVMCRGNLDKGIQDYNDSLMKDAEAGYKWSMRHAIVGVWVFSNP